MTHRRFVRIACCIAVAGGVAAALGAMSRAPVAAAGDGAHSRPVDPRFAFGLQNVPKFDERAHHGGWNGTRARGLAMRHDLGATVGREGLLWSKFQPNGPQPGPYLRDFDDAILSVWHGGMALEAMVTESPAWASTASHIDPNNPNSYKNAPPKGLYAPVFADGTDRPAPGKAPNPANTWAQALAAMADRYHGRVRYWQVWNEPDYPNGALNAGERDPRRSWTGSVEDYVRLLHVSRLVLAAHDQGAAIATGGLGHEAYLDAMLAHGAAPDFDFVDFHAYGWPGSDTALDVFLKVRGAMAGTLARHGASKGLICSETGYSSAEPQEQADYVAKLYPTAIATGVESTMYYADVNPCWRNMGLVDWRTLSQRTSGYWAYKHASAALHDVRRVTPLAIPGLRGYRFERAGAAPLYIVWASHDARGRTFELPVGPGNWTIHDATGRLLSREAGPRLALTLASSPRWIDGDAQRAYAQPVPNPPLAHNGLALARCVADGSAPGQGGPEAAIDSDTDTHWTSGGFKVDHAWLKIALARPGALNRLRVKTGPTAPGTWFDVETSLDGEHFAAVATGLRIASWHMEDIAFTRPVDAAYVRLVWHNPSRSPAHFNVFEVEAY